MVETGTGQRVYLENVGIQTRVTIASSSAGQQQQSSSSVTTGNWAAPPEAFQTAEGIIIKLNTAQGKSFVRIQGSSMSGLTSAPSLSQAQAVQMQSVAGIPSANLPDMQPMQPIQPMEPMQPMKPIEPMKPMQMGDMEMSLNPMAMRMGNMAMQMGKSAPTTTANATHRFCTHCGTPVNPDDRFCGSCGHKLG